MQAAYSINVRNKSGQLGCRQLNSEQNVYQQNNTTHHNDPLNEENLSGVVFSVTPFVTPLLQLSYEVKCAHSFRRDYEIKLSSFIFGSLYCTLVNRPRNICIMFTCKTNEQGRSGYSRFIANC